MNNYPKYAQIKDRKYKINTNYKVAIECDKVSKLNIVDEERVAIKCNNIALDNSIGEYEKSLAIIYKLFGDEGLKNSQDWNELLLIALKYLNCGKEREREKEKTEQDKKQREALKSNKKKAPKQETEITEELKDKVSDLLIIGVREQRITGILNIDFKSLETIRNQLIEERESNKKRNKRGGS